MKKIVIIAVAIIAVVGIYFGYTSMNSKDDNTTTQVTYQDGVYTETEVKDGTTYEVEVTIEGGKITTISADEIGADGTSKTEKSKAGEYVMSPDEVAPWHEQVQNFLNVIIDDQSTKSLTYVDGKVDSVSSCSITVETFGVLVDAALVKAASGEGSSSAEGLYVDGVYKKESAEPSNGYTAVVEVTVSGGKIAAITADEISEDGSSKLEKAAKGEYVMQQGEANSWDKQVEIFTNYVVENQGTEGLTFVDQKVDAISSCTIKVEAFATLINEALADAAK